MARIHVAVGGGLESRSSTLSTGVLIVTASCRTSHRGPTCQCPARLSSERRRLEDNCGTAEIVKLFKRKTLAVYRLFDITFSKYVRTYAMRMTCSRSDTVHNQFAVFAHAFVLFSSSPSSSFAYRVRTILAPKLNHPALGLGLLKFYSITKYH